MYVCMEATWRNNEAVVQQGLKLSRKRRHWMSVIDNYII